MVRPRLTLPRICELIWTKCCCVPNDSHANRHFENDSPGARCERYGPASPKNQDQWYRKFVVGRNCDGSCYLRGPLSLVCYSKHNSVGGCRLAMLTLCQYNFLSENLPEVSKQDQFLLWLLRLAFIGFVASVVSDSISNSLRVVKTYRQVNDIKVSYGKICCSKCLGSFH